MKHGFKACIIVPNLTRNLSSYALIENVVTKMEYEGKGYARACLEYAKQVGTSQLMIIDEAAADYLINKYNL